MSENSNIEWTDHTFNPWEGCQKAGPGCDNCYAETRNARFSGGTAINWGASAPRRRTSLSNWKKPVAWNNAHSEFVAAHGRRQRVFCASLSDVFDNSVDPQWRADLFTLIQSTPNLDWLLLTKRIGNVASMVTEACKLISGGEERQSQWAQGMWPKNVWLGATIVNQAEADRDIPKLLDIPAEKRFLSMEPLLGQVDLRGNVPAERALRWHRPMLNMLDWVIVGGESGPGARPMHPDWARDLRNQCAAANVPFLFKQWGEWRPAYSFQEATSYPVIASNRKVAAPPGPAREFRPASGCFHMPHQVESMIDGSGEYAYLDCAMFKAGKKAAGRLLDGMHHDGYPTFVTEEIVCEQT